jgi:hypothetical protein
VTPRDPEFHPERTLPHHEEFVLVGVMVPGEFALDLDDLDLLPVEHGDGLGPPMLVEQGIFLVERDFLYPATSRTLSF